MGGAFDEVTRAALAPILTFVTAIARSMYYGRKRWPSCIMEGVLRWRWQRSPFARRWSTSA